ncbi:hypothetical protein [Thermococcus stetteri]|uniref:hypothetical protein n=1 Tax=Thermococcus stetteri TaxID=49900 RepID=UPI001AE36660|nr:hypothetical protein [Thermococcus stetteri]MBP1912422.1 hypothetical protein [Thermococcus stetteri]
MIFLTFCRFMFVKYWRHYLPYLVLTLPSFFIHSLLPYVFGLVWVGVVSVEEEIRNPPGKFLPLPLTLCDIALGRVLFKLLTTLPYALLSGSDIIPMVTFMSEIEEKKLLVPMILLYPFFPSKYLLWAFVLAGFVISCRYLGRR